MAKERKYYQLPLDPIADEDINAHLNSLNRNTRPDFVKSAIREKMDNKNDKHLSKQLEDIIRASVEKVLEEKLNLLMSSSTKTNVDNTPEKTKKKPKRVNL